jgi:methionine salvage enolase-phosphatase E1
VFGSEAGFVKGKAHFDKILNMTGFLKNELLFVGNDRKDFEIGTGYGISSLIVDRDKNGPGLLGIVQDILAS